MKNTGILRIQAFGARQSSPIEGVLVTVSGNGFTAQRITDETGTAADLSIEAPSCALSLQEDNTIRPYAVVDLTATKAGFRTVRIQGVQIFAGQVTLAQPEMIPETEEDRDVVNPPIVIPEHSLFTGDGGSGPDPMENCVPRVLSRVIIPKNITVHLGKPAASARNVTVSFRDYIANVASSEVYPTWPEQALRANIHCQISLALNRIYTEWYPSKGYTFNITNSTSYDQYYVHGRTVFDVMVRITDDIFNTYLRKTGTVNPYYSEYCDGKSVTCPGLKQWGTVTLANQGRNALQILKYYYGNDIEIIRTSNIQSIPQSYPGSPIRQGDSGTAVFTLQRQLNRITKDYPFLGLLTVDGVFGARMAATVRAFQKQFNLTADGMVGRQTWYKISYIYVSVKDLAELTSEGEVSSGTLSDGTWGGTVLRTGSTGSAVTTQTSGWQTGLGVLTETSDEGRTGTIHTIAAAVLLDGEGKVADVMLDELEVELSADGKGAVTMPTDYRTKRQKGDDYPLAAASSLKKGWAEQADDFADYLTGLTPQQAARLETDKDGRAADPDLLSGCTIRVDKYRDAVAKACASAAPLGGAKGDRVSLGVEAENASSDITATDDKDVNAEVDLTVVALTLDADGRVTSAIGDMAEPALTIAADGGVTAPDTVRSKLELGDSYGMRNASSLGKEWYEHSEGYCSYLKGKTEKEVADIPADGSDADLAALCTISIDALQKAVGDAFENAGL